MRGAETPNCGKASDGPQSLRKMVHKPRKEPHLILLHWATSAQQALVLSITVFILKLQILGIFQELPNYPPKVLLSPLRNKKRKAANNWLKKNDDTPNTTILGSLLLKVSKASEYHRQTPASLAGKLTRRLGLPPKIFHPVTEVSGKSDSLPTL